MQRTVNWIYGPVPAITIKRWFITSTGKSVVYPDTKDNCLYTKYSTFSYHSFDKSISVYKYNLSNLPIYFNKWQPSDCLILNRCDCNSLTHRHNVGTSRTSETEKRVRNERHSTCKRRVDRSDTILLDQSCVGLAWRNRVPALVSFAELYPEQPNLSDLQRDPNLLIRFDRLDCR